MKLAFIGLIFIASCFSAVSAKPAIKSQVPLSISSVESYRVDEKLVRIIRYNTALVPRLDIELIKVPGRVLLATLVIKKIQVNYGRRKVRLDFDHSAAVGIDKVMVNKNKKHISFEVEYFGGGHTGSYFLASCYVSVKASALSEPACRILKTEVD